MPDPNHLPDRLPSGTVTFLFTDIEGSTTMWEHHRESMGVALARHDTLMRQCIVGHGGHVVKTMGDGFHAAFACAPDALEAALAAQHALHARTSRTMSMASSIESTRFPARRALPDPS